MSFKQYTLPRFITVLLASLWLCSSCIDEFEADLPANDLQYLVVEGDICGQSDCEFVLSRSLSLNPTADELLGRKISDARLFVCGSDNSHVPANQKEAGRYLVTLGELNPSLEYWIEIEWDGRTYQSTPTTPLKTPAINDLRFEQPREDLLVDILITPNTEGAGVLQYFLWDYQEDWEIVTPFLAEWAYNPASDKIEPATVILNRGWCKDLNHPSIIGKNADFANNEIHDLRLIALNNLDNRFNRRYCITVRQRAITREQFEYEQLAQRQSDDMGGLFTPQPSELPSNIRCNDGKSKAIGYIGVALNAVQRRLFISSSSVGYHLTRIPRTLSEDEVKEFGPDALTLHDRGFRVKTFDPMTGQVEWTDRWGVDATAWGASLVMPDFWSEE